MSAVELLKVLYDLMRVEDKNESSWHSCNRGICSGLFRRLNSATNGLNILKNIFESLRIALSTQACFLNFKHQILIWNMKSVYKQTSFKPDNDFHQMK